MIKKYRNPKTYLADLCKTCKLFDVECEGMRIIKNSEIYCPDYKKIKRR